MTDTPNPVDLHVGAAIRTRRRLVGVSQEALAAALGLTFQQVQKYERGSNRVSASKLYEIARRLGVGIGHFFEGLADPASGQADHVDGGREGALHAFLMTAEGLEVAQIWPTLPRRQRARLIDLIRAMAESVDDGADRPAIAEAA